MPNPLLPNSKAVTDAAQGAWASFIRKYGVLAVSLILSVSSLVSYVLRNEHLDEKKCAEAVIFWQQKYEFAALESAKKDSIFDAKELDFTTREHALYERIIEVSKLLSKNH